MKIIFIAKKLGTVNFKNNNTSKTITTATTQTANKAILQASGQWNEGDEKGLAKSHTIKH